MISAFSKSLFFTSLVFSLMLNTSAIFADTVTLTNGKEIKGLVVDEYVDRIFISTFEGEKTFLRKDIKSVQYEDPQTRLLKLGDDQMTRGKYKAAIYYYRAVLKLDPYSIQARDGEIAAVRKELGSGAEIAKEEIDLMIALDGSALGAAKDVPAAYEKNIEKLLGLKIKRDKELNVSYVDKVLPGSVSADYGILKNDIIAAIWNENVKYMEYGEIIYKLAGPEFSMVKLSIEREISFPDPKKIKLDIGLREDGYFIKDISGAGSPKKTLIKPGDWLIEVNKTSTRYMPEGTLKNMLRETQSPLVLLIKRDLYMTREKGE